MGLLGSFGAWLGSYFGGNQAPPSQPKPTVRVGTGGYAIYGGFEQSNETNPDLAGARRYRTYTNAYINLPIAAKGLRLYLDLCSGAEWTCKPADDKNKKARDIAEQCEKLLGAGRQPWRQIVRYQARFCHWDHSIQAWTGRQLADGQWCLDVEPRPNHTIWRWDIDLTTGEFRGVWQLSPQTLTEFYLPRNRLLYSVDATLTDAPSGLGIARHIVDSSRRIDRYRQLEGYGFESDLAGTPVARIPYALLDDMVGKSVAGRTFTADDRNKMVEGLETFIKNHQRNPARGVALESAPYTNNDGTPSSVKQWDIETLNTSTAPAQVAINSAIEREEHRAAILVDAEHLLLSGTKNAGGTKAVSGDKMERVAQNVNGRLAELADVLNVDYIKPLGMLNGWPEELLPKLVPADVTPLDVEAASRVLMNLAAAMLAPDDEADNYIRNELGLPERPAPTAAALNASLMAGRGQPQTKQPTPLEPEQAAAQQQRQDK